MWIDHVTDNQQKLVKRFNIYQAEQGMYIMDYNLIVYFSFWWNLLLNTNAHCRPMSFIVCFLHFQSLFAHSPSHFTKICPEEARTPALFFFRELVQMSFTSLCVESCLIYLKEMSPVFIIQSEQSVVNVVLVRLNIVIVATTSTFESHTLHNDTIRDVNDIWTNSLKKK